MAMNPKLKLWLDSLRGGSYKQGEGVLKSIDGNFCCLGVLADLCSKEVPEISWVERYGFPCKLVQSVIDESSTSAGQRIIKWANLGELDEVKDINSYKFPPDIFRIISLGELATSLCPNTGAESTDMQSMLMTLNDKRVPFPLIADFIELNLVKPETPTQV